MPIEEGAVPFDDPPLEKRAGQRGPAKFWQDGLIMRIPEGCSKPRWVVADLAPRFAIVLRNVKHRLAFLSFSEAEMTEGERNHRSSGPTEERRERMEEITDAAMEILRQEAEARDEKTRRLRALRQEREKETEHK
ncbi:hypothetical protein IHQ71_21305 [Rhizobium sp. TH2]|uniref:hypothetical protein n=1 Tax=Rhizobium sp. TH2 TaxID=2775403 RepID=UPI002156FB3F|nr:hypothetical protein [Rhizobium sp. TH2]UVC07707.1 hypothetical protein IHQ71_21305 [Rhizobium sp. TH2]